MVLAVLVGVLGHAQSHALLVGSTGVGKSHVCNMFDGTVCERRVCGEHSCTRAVYVGQRFIDTPGFGETQGTDTHPTLGTLQVILRGVNGTRLTSIMWVVPCVGQRRTPGEVWSAMTLLSAFIGSQVPVIVLFNTVTAQNIRCERGVEKFMATARAFGIPVSAHTFFTLEAGYAGSAFANSMYERLVHVRHSVAITGDMDAIFGRIRRSRVRTSMAELMNGTAAELKCAEARRWQTALALDLWQRHPETTVNNVRTACQEQSWDRCYKCPVMCRIVPSDALMKVVSTTMAVAAVVFPPAAAAEWIASAAVVQVVSAVRGFACSKCETNETIVGACVANSEAVCKQSRDAIRANQDLAAQQKLFWCP